MEEVNQVLIDNYQMKPFVIETIDGSIETIELEEMDYTIDFMDSLITLRESHNPLFWGFQLFQNDNRILLPTHTFHKEDIIEKLENLTFMKTANQITEYGVEIIATPEGYQLEDISKDILNPSKAVEEILNNISSGESYISLETARCYKDLPITKEMEDTYTLWNKINEFQTFGFIYQFGNEIEKIDASVLAKWIVTNEVGEIELDENNEISWNPKKIEDYIETLADKYDTYDIPRTIQTTEGRTVTIENGNYGNQLDQEKEIEYLTDAFEHKSVELRTPEYKHKALYQGLDDIGDTYIEIDMTYQRMYYYHEGELALETPIVTGSERGGMLTPAKVCYVYFMQLDRVLVGKDYRTPVDYWMAVNSRIGIHDANWRDEFGGEIYKTNGSHGCVNTPPEKAGELYEMVEEGTPVLMYY